MVERWLSDAASRSCSNVFAKPAWQTDAGCGNRTVADVSANAGWPGVAIYNTLGLGGWSNIGGTSLSSPLVAAVYALAYPTVPLATTYTRTASLFDITSGDNGDCAGSYLCTAGPGFDGPTGLGTPCGTAAFGAGPFVSSCPAAAARAAGQKARSATPPVVATPICPEPGPGEVGCLAKRLTPG